MNKDDYAKWGENLWQQLDEIDAWAENGENTPRVNALRRQLDEILKELWEEGYEEGFRVGSGADRDD